MAASAAAGSMAAASAAEVLRDEVSEEPASRDEVLRADSGVPASREAAPWLLVVLAFAASVWSGDLAGAVLAGAVLRGAVPDGAEAGPELDGAAVGADGDGAGRLRLASPLVRSRPVPGTILMRGMTSVWSGTALAG